MTDELTPEEAEAKATAEAALKQGTFSFIDALTGRDYPTEDVEVYLDERAGHRIETLEQKLANERDPDKANALTEELEAERAKVAKSRYVITLEGIPVDEYDAVVDAALEQYPLEYIETRHPLTMGLERIEKASPDREQFFRTHLWAKFIRKVTGPTGGVDENISPEWTALFLAKAPIIAIVRVETAVQKLRMTSDWMDRMETEDFLAKS